MRNYKFNRLGNCIFEVIKGRNVILKIKINNGDFLPYSNFELRVYQETGISHYWDKFPLQKQETIRRLNWMINHRGKVAHQKFCGNKLFYYFNVYHFERCWEVLKYRL